MKNQNYLLALLTGLVLIFGITSCSKDDDSNNQYKMSNQDFVTKASSSNMLEIAAGQLAINQGANADVKAYGQHMVTDHGTAATEMSALAQKKNLSIPTAMLPEHQEVYNTLKNLTGSAFDKQYAAMMVTSHQQTIALFQDASGNNGVPDGDIRGFAAGKLPTLQEHLQHAQELQTKVN